MAAARRSVEGTAHAEGASVEDTGVDPWGILVRRNFPPIPVRGGTLLSSSTGPVRAVASSRMRLRIPALFGSFLLISCGGHAAITGDPTPSSGEALPAASTPVPTVGDPTPSSGGALPAAGSAPEPIPAPTMPPSPMQPAPEVPVSQPVPMGTGQGALVPGSPSTEGLGPCSGTTLGEVVERIHALEPELSDITKMAAITPATTPEQYPGPGDSFYQARIYSDHMLVGLRRCTAGVLDFVCPVSSYWFFTTDASCEPALKSTYTQRKMGDCYEVEGAAEPWFHGVIAERQRCDFDANPADVGGTHALYGLAMGSICGDGVGSFEPREISLTISQPEYDPSRVTVYFDQVASCIDEVPLKGRVFENLLELDQPLGEPSVSCGALAKVTASIDMSGAPMFGGPFNGILDYWTRAEVCGELPHYRRSGGYHFMPVPLP